MEAFIWRWVFRPILGRIRNLSRGNPGFADGSLDTRPGI
jgi:hypothetical protein